VHHRTSAPSREFSASRNRRSAYIRLVGVVSVVALVLALVALSIIAGGPGVLAHAAHGIATDCPSLYSTC